jgi:DNA polymerase-3 subunit alpha
MREVISSEEPIALFKSHYSLGRSILTLESPEDVVSHGPDSIFSLCREAGLKEMFLVEDNMSSFLQAYSNSEKEKIKPIFGLRLNVCPDLSVKNDESLTRTSKIILMIKNRAGYQALIKIFSRASKEGFYYAPRADYNLIKEHYNEKNILIALPYYDSYLHLNSLENKSCVPDLSFCDPYYFKEDNDLPFNFIIDKAIKDIAKPEKIIRTKSIYYNERKDFKSYLTFRCITSRSFSKNSTLDKPNLDHMSSDEFSCESWKEAHGIG